MSIRIMTKVWDSGAYSGGTLLVLLALADFAGDDGKRIFPHVETLAKKARLSIRATQMALETLRTDGILKAVANATGGRGKSVEYQMDMERVNNLREPTKGADDNNKGCNPRQERVQENTERVQSATSHIDNHQEPSVTVNEPPEASPPSAATHVDLLGDPPPQTPAAILDSAYAAFDAASGRAGWPKVQKRTGARDAALRKRLKDAGGLDGWLAALAKAEGSDFCCGRAPPTPPRTEPFLADFDFLTTESKFVRLMEGKYDNREGPSKSGSSGSLGIAARVAARRAAGRAGANAEN